jgi:hypothetical protein
MAAIESNLLMTGEWEAAEEVGEPNLAEYHLDWWNGFNQHNNDDIDPPWGEGLEVHMGGDYRVASAYLTRNEGAVRDIDGQSYNDPPERSDPSYHYYYTREIEWYVAGPDLSNIDTIKNAAMNFGAVGTCMCYDSSFIDGYYRHYQPPSSSWDPNHAIAIVGWDDNKVTQAPEPGAWICKNSWGSDWGLDGYFWISYYDKHSCQHPEMGAISFQDAEPMAYNRVYYHDYHGWRDTETDVYEAFNAFTAAGGEQGQEQLKAVSFFTAADDVYYEVIIYDNFDGNTLLDEITSKTGFMQYSGFHTVDLDELVSLEPDDDFYVYLGLSAGGHPFDRTSDVPVLLGAQYDVIVRSSANPEESYYKSGSKWLDFYDVEETGNFCIKALSVEESYLGFDYPEGLPELLDPNGGTTVRVEVYGIAGAPEPGTGMLHYNSGTGWESIAMEVVAPNVYDAVFPGFGCADLVEFYFSAETVDDHLVKDPRDAPLVTYSALSATELVTAFEDNFELNKGWTVENQNLSDGAWDRGIPVGQGDRGDPPTDFDGSGQCYVTDNVDGDSDVDGGPTQLISPAFDLSYGDDAFIYYARWFYNDDQDEDRLDVHISNDNGSTWHLVESVPHTAGWVYTGFRVSDYVTLTTRMKIRFSATDNPNDSVTEAGIDAFKAVCVLCEEHGDVTIEITPHNPPVTVPRGGSFAYSGELVNNEPSSQTVDIWVMVTLPNQKQYGPVEQINNLLMSPNQTITRSNIVQDVPMNAPLGTYDYTAYCGIYPSVVFDSSTFEVTVTSSKGRGNRDWKVRGWTEE